MMFASVVEQVLASWTALDLAVGHYEGQFRAAQEKRINLYTSLCDVIPEEKYSAIDIGEYLADYLLEEFAVELDDNSHFDVANVLLNSWSMIKEGKVPNLSSVQSGMAGSVLRSDIVEVDGCVTGESSLLHATNGGQTEQPHQSLQMETDEDGWSTIVRK